MSWTFLLQLSPEVPKLNPNVKVGPECKTSPSINESVAVAKVFDTVKGLESPEITIWTVVF